MSQALLQVISILRFINLAKKCLQELNIRHNLQADNPTAKKGEK